MTCRSVSDAVIAFSPGAQDTMMVLALALHLDPVFVGALQISRFLIVSLLVPFMAHRIGRKIAPASKQNAARRYAAYGSTELAEVRFALARRVIFRRSRRPIR